VAQLWAEAAQLIHLHHRTTRTWDSPGEAVNGREPVARIAAFAGAVLLAAGLTWAEVTESR
jgi:hypothetical protein